MKIERRTKDRREDTGFLFARTLWAVCKPDSCVTLDQLRGDIRVITEFIHSGMLETASDLAARAGA